MSEVKSKMINWVWRDEEFTHFKHSTEKVQFYRKVFLKKKKNKRERERKKKSTQEKWKEKHAIANKLWKTVETGTFKCLAGY